MLHDRAEETDIDADGDGTGAFFGAALPKLNEEVARKIADTCGADGRAEALQRVVLTAAEGTVQLGHVGVTEVDEVGECFTGGGEGAGGRFTLVDAVLLLARPGLGLVLETKRTTDRMAISAYLSTPLTRR